MATLSDYRQDIVTFLEAEFWVPDRRNEKGRILGPGPIILAPHQKRILRMAFQRDGEGRFGYDTIIYSAPKKSGKTTIAAGVVLYIAASEEAPNEVYIVANDLEQARSRVYSVVQYAVRHSPLFRGSAKVLRTEIVLNTGTVIKAISSDYAGAAGANHSLVTHDELWGTTSEDGRRLYEELTPVPTRKNSLRFISTYAGWEGESKLLWDLYNHVLTEGECQDRDFNIWRCGSIFMYWDHKPRMVWQTPQYYERERTNPAMRPNTFDRLHRNEWRAAQDRFVEGDWWDQCVKEDWTPLAPNKVTTLDVAVDIGTKHDSSAVVATFKDADGKVWLAWHQEWIPGQEGLDIENTVERYLLMQNERYTLGQVVYDPNQFHRSAQTLRGQGLNMLERPGTNPYMVAIASDLFALLKGRNIVLYEDERLRECTVNNAVAIETRRGPRLAKEKASRRIDLTVALAMAAHESVGRAYVVPGPRPHFRDPEAPWVDPFEEKLPAVFRQ